MAFQTDVFGTYDVRGIYPDGINEDLAYALGGAFASVHELEKVFVGQDARLSSPSLTEALCRGFQESGVVVRDIGVVSTDQCHYACAAERSAGVIVTASHNPPEYNGFKLIDREGMIVGRESGLKEIEDAVRRGARLSVSAPAERISTSVVRDYLDFVFSRGDPSSIRDVSVVADPGHGSLGPALETFFSDLTQCDAEIINAQPDGRFPKRGPNPVLSENQEPARARIRETGADIGFVYDGDGDRMCVIDSAGRFVPPDFVTALIAEHLILRGEASEAVVYDAMASWAIAETVERIGGRALRERVGRAYISGRMREERALFGGEGSGHYYFRDFFYSDSALLATLLVLEVLSSRRVSFNKRLAELREQYHLSGQINRTLSRDPSLLLDEVAEVYSAGSVDRLDGVSVEFDDWHFTLRASNTEPLVRLMVEARSHARMEEGRDEVLSIISQYE